MADRPARSLPHPPWAVWTILTSLCIAAHPAAFARGSELRRTPIVKAVEAAAPSVVNIRGEKMLGASDLQIGRADASRRVNGMGTGVVIDPRGYIITNHHVVDGVREILVTMADGHKYTATLISRDSETDLALIKIEAADRLPVINIGTSNDLMPGEPVVAVGNAYGYEHTVTRGIISALHRPVQVTDAQFYDDLIQTDASINPGNSGGPLLNIDGEMIGINVAVRAGAQGIGFAIPVDKTMAVAADLLAAHSAQICWHGLEVEATAAEAEAGVVVRSVASGSPAEKAGVQAGDRITRLNERDVARALDFHRGILDRDLDEPVHLTLRRGEQSLSLTFELAEAPGDLKPAVDRHWAMLGLRLKPIPTKDFRAKFRTQYRGGLTVAAVRAGSPAAVHGIRPGDVLVGMHEWETITLDNVDYIVDYVISRPDEETVNPVKFFILRGNETLFGLLPIPLAMKGTQRR